MNFSGVIERWPSELEWLAKKVTDGFEVHVNGDEKYFPIYKYFPVQEDTLRFATLQLRWERLVIRLAAPNHATVGLFDETTSSEEWPVACVLARENVERCHEALKVADTPSSRAKGR